MSPPELDTGFLSSGYLWSAGSAGLVRAVSRMFLHFGFPEVWNVDGPGDGGADVIAERPGERWVVQSKWRKSGDVGSKAVDEVIGAWKTYSANRGLVVTNQRFNSAAEKKVMQANEQGLRIDLLDGMKLEELYSSDRFAARLKPIDLRNYQDEALSALEEKLGVDGLALLVMATGLGKTVVAGELIGSRLARDSSLSVLVVAQSKDLVRQLERSMWPHISREVPTNCLLEGHIPDDLPGISVATVQAADQIIRSGYQPDLMFVDEAHHIGEDSVTLEMIETVRAHGGHVFGATATPWRGDGFDITEVLGEAAYTLGISQGMRRGYLSDVRYQLFVSNVNWDAVTAQSKNGYTVKELNKRLFLPQLDENIRDHLIGVWEQTPNPRAIVFCRTTEHADRMASLLSAVPQFQGATTIHSKMSKRDRNLALLRFRSGEIPLITACDVLNEGVDVPDVNIVCFARVTHSRRIFVQQMGRGLRVSPGKDYVRVLDFVSDIRRVAAVIELEQGLSQGGTDSVLLPAQERVSFSDEEAEDLLRVWLEDVADVESADDGERLDFPPVQTPG